MDLTSLIIQLASGAVGGNVAGSFLKRSSLGIVGNSIAGIVGGGLGGQLLGMVGAGGTASGGLDLGSIISSVAAGGAGGGIFMFIVGYIRKMTKK